MLGQRYTTPMVTVVCPVTSLHHMASLQSASSCNCTSYAGMVSLMYNNTPPPHMYKEKLGRDVKGDVLCPLVLTCSLHSVICMLFYMLANLLEHYANVYPSRFSS